MNLLVLVVPDQVNKLLGVDEKAMEMKGKMVPLPQKKELALPLEKVLEPLLKKQLLWLAFQNLCMP